MNEYILPFSKIDLASLSKVGGKNASLGEMFNNLNRLKVDVPDGFAVTVEAYRAFLSQNYLTETLGQLLSTMLL